MLSFSLLECFSKIVKFKDTEIPDKTKMHILHLLFFQVPTSYSANIINLKKKKKNREIFPGMTNDFAFYVKLRSSAQRTDDGCINTIFNLEWTIGHTGMSAYMGMHTYDKFTKKKIIEISISFLLVT